MPILVVYGIPTETSQKTLEFFADFMKQKVVDVQELCLKKDQVSIFFPTDLMSQGLGEEIIVFVEGLTEKPERNNAVRRKLAANLVDAVFAYFTKTKVIECFVRPFNVNSGFCFSQKTDLEALTS